MGNYWKRWALAAIVRALKTAAQTAIALWPVSALIADVNWALIGSGAAGAAFLSLLTSLGGLPEVEIEE